MKISARVLATKTDEHGRFLAKIQLNGKTPKVGDIIRCEWGKSRSVSQNKRYWLLLTWYVEEGGLDDYGYMTKEELHEKMKERLLQVEHTDGMGITTIRTRSTTELTTDEFKDYMDKLEALIFEYCEVSSQPFWEEFAQQSTGR